uniref:Uncharacterized protein n=1 Tax=Arion vulgaris TaxID=1028688 RepID=A0A0B7AH97_9EUPU
MEETEITQKTINNKRDKQRYGHEFVYLMPVVIAYDYDEAEVYFDYKMTVDEYIHTISIVITVRHYYFLRIQRRISVI